MPRNYVKSLVSSLMLVSLLYLSGCATLNQPSPSACPVLPIAPSLKQPLPTESYSQSVEKRMQEWDARLTDIRKMLER